MKEKGFPKWKNEGFPRLAGLLDRLFHKAAIRQDPGGPLLHSGRVVRVQRRFDRYQRQVEEWLLEQLHPLNLEAAQLVLACEALHLVQKPSAAATSGAIREARLAEAKRAEQLARLKEDRQRLVQISNEMEFLCQLTDSRIEQAKSASEVELALYSKATRFHVVDREIPTLNRTFFARSVLDRHFLDKINRQTGQERSKEASE